MGLLERLKNLIVASPQNGQVMTLRELSEKTGVTYHALALAVWEGRLSARKSGGTWLTTVGALEDAIAAGRMKAPSHRL